MIKVLEEYTIPRQSKKEKYGKHSRNLQQIRKIQYTIKINFPEVYTLRQRHSELLKTTREDYRVNFFREIAKIDTITKAFPKNNTPPSVIFLGDFTIKDEPKTL